jgi:hypothetical protein
MYTAAGGGDSHVICAAEDGQNGSIRLAPVRVQPLCMTAGLPDPVMQRLRPAFLDAMRASELRRKLEDAGARPWTPAAEAPEVVLAQYQQVETEKYARVVDFAKIKE